MHSNLALLTLIALPLVVWAGGIPVCTPGTQSCELGGCYTGLVAVCHAAQCYPKVLGMVASITVPCLPYANACAGNYCDTGAVCISGQCVPDSTSTAVLSAAVTAAPSADAPANASSPRPAAAPKAAARAAATTPLGACLAARAQLRTCSSDPTPLVVAAAMKLGYAAPSGDVECYESSQFKCCASTNATGPAAAAAAGGMSTGLVYTCKGSIILESAVAGIVNTTANFLNAFVGGSGAGGNGTKGPSPLTGPTATGGNATAAPQQPILQPLFQGLANVVAATSQALLGAHNGTAGNSSSKAQRAPASAVQPQPLFKHSGLNASGAQRASVPLMTAVVGMLVVLLPVLFS